MKAHLAAHSGHAKAVAVGADALDHALDQMRGFRVARLAKAERVHRGNRARAHGKDVAQDAADAGGSALMRLDIRGVVVAFHLEHHGLPVTDIDDTRVFARPADHLRPGGRQGAQPFLGRLVGTMLVPHGGKDAELGKRRLAPDDPQKALIFVGLQPMRSDQVFGDLRLVHVASPGVGRMCGPDCGYRLRHKIWAGLGEG
ncbi:hypothetical protein GALL_424880 [mine drainage metagenome]|uniref:Uncharacterized protein n=1 Tax=mine drainage metagenome TaxID=410659 RepID=A0A1J5QIL2_9ZZZZ